MSCYPGRLSRRLAIGAAAMAVLSAPRAHARTLGNFDAADANHDGRVTLQEFEAYAAQRLATRSGPIAARFRRFSPDQQTLRLQRRFERMDHGNKGYLDRDDWNNS